MNKGYYRALQIAKAYGGDESNVKSNGNNGWYADNQPLPTEYDENGDAIAFT